MNQKTCLFDQIKEGEFFSTPLGKYQKIKVAWGKHGPNNAIRQENQAKVCFASFEPVTPHPPLKLIDVMTFGKHKGETIQEIIDNAPDYLAWAIDKRDWFELDEQAEQALWRALGYNDDGDDYDDRWHEAFDLLA